MRAVAAQLQPEDEFAAAREQFAQMEAFLMSDEAHRKTHSELERELEQQGRELLRRFYQAHLELRAPGEAAAAVRDSEGQVRQQRRRQQRGLETVFGEVRVERLGYGGEGLQSLHPLDADLNLPPELYSHQVDQRAYLNRMLRLALPFFRRRNIPRENASSNARYPRLTGYAIHAAPARSIWISRSLLTGTHFLGRTAAKSWVSPKTGAPAPPPPRPPSLPSPPPAGY